MFPREKKDTEWIISVKFLKIVKSIIEPNTIDLEDIEAVILALEEMDNQVAFETVDGPVTKDEFKIEEGAK